MEPFLPCSLGVSNSPDVSAGLMFVPFQESGLLYEGGEVSFRIELLKPQCAPEHLCNADSGLVSLG